MIIKSLSRWKIVKNILQYVDRHEKDDEYRIYHNIWKNEDINWKFEENFKHTKQRKNSVFVYHEIISIPILTKLTREKQKEALMEIVQEYIRLRADGNIVYGVLHDEGEKKNIHYHLVISSNWVMQSKKTRLSIKEFETIKRKTENFAKQKIPELWPEKLQQQNRVAEKLKKIFLITQTKQEFFEALEMARLEIYIRWKNTIWFLDQESGKKHRLKTLNLVQEFQGMSLRFEQPVPVQQEQNREPPQGTQREATPYKEEKTPQEHLRPDVELHTETLEVQKEVRQTRAERRKEEMKILRALKEQRKELKIQNSILKRWRNLNTSRQYDRFTRNWR
jgi:hypothetical protein